MLLFAAVLAASASVATIPLPRPGSRVNANCPRTTSYLADTSGIYRGSRLAPRKLNQLPPGTTYMAVYRRIDGCDAPLTMVEYRNPRRP
jgi:outer membrane protein assembly factor BamE (lipoprotein component of BamABCDE complex)